MSKFRELLSRHRLISEFAESFVPDAFRFDKHLKQRRSVIKDPRLVLTNHIRSPLAYACFCLLAPTVILYIALQLAQAVGFVQPTQLERTIGELRGAESEANQAPARIREICRRNFADEPLMVGACQHRLQERARADAGDLRDALVMLDYSQRFREFASFKALIMGPLILIVNAYWFAFLWTRAFSPRLTPTAEDRANTRTAYLLTMGTTAFVPTLLATCALLAAELIDRSSVPWTLISFAPTISFLGALPLFVGSMLSAQRLHKLLNKEEDWKIGKPMRIMLVSNFLTLLMVGPLFFVAIVWLNL